MGVCISISDAQLRVASGNGIKDTSWFSRASLRTQVSSNSSLSPFLATFLDEHVVYTSVSAGERTPDFQVSVLLYKRQMSARLSEGTLLPSTGDTGLGPLSETFVLSWFCPHLSLPFLQLSFWAVSAGHNASLLSRKTRNSIWVEIQDLNSFSKG